MDEINNIQNLANYYLTRQKNVSNISDMILMCLLYSLLGLIAGLFINALSKKIISYYEITGKDKIIALQIFLCALLFIIIQKIYPAFASSWVNTTQGMFLTSIFFGTQYKLFDTIETSNLFKSKII